MMVVNAIDIPTATKAMMASSTWNIPRGLDFAIA
jgi:hypothetical protein